MNIKRLKRHLISTVWPHRHNSWQPYILRAPALAFATSAVAALLIGVNLSNGGRSILGVAENITANEIISATNDARAEAGIAKLRVSEELNKAAAAKAKNMFAVGYWDHYGPGGETPWQFIREQDYHYRLAGENLAKDFQTGHGVIAGWIGSPEHRDNLLHAGYEEIGVAVADGRLHGRDTTLVVAIYAQPYSSDVFLGTGGIETGEILPAHASYTLVNPLNLFATMSLTSKVIGLILLGFGGLYLVQHIVVREQHLLWDKHIHPHPALQAALFFGLSVLLVQSSFGAVG